VRPDLANIDLLRPITYDRSSGHSTDDIRLRRGLFEHPDSFFIDPAESNRELSSLTEAVAQYINPVIIRSTPLLPVPRNNFIDDHNFARIEAAGIEPTPFSSDSEFLRRVTLDFTGRIPPLNEFTNFI
jgi:hypothetical protein